MSVQRARVKGGPRRRLDGCPRVLLDDRSQRFAI